MGTQGFVFIVLGSLFAFLSVAAGAFGAHALKSILDPNMLMVYETAAKYQMYHAFALFVVTWQMTRLPASRVSLAGWLFCLGIILFSGSLYIVAVFGLKGFGAVTPLGGVAFLTGWAILGWTAWRHKATA